jgi:hypothetical protein
MLYWAVTGIGTLVCIAIGFWLYFQSRGKASTGTAVTAERDAAVQ